jgi:predicted O-methyltransferase YrrM
MDSLTTDPVASVLKRLYQEAHAADRALVEDFVKNAAGQDPWTTLLAEEARDYRALYRGKYARNFLSVTPEFGRFLYMCGRASKAKLIVEFGTSFGISTIHLACALRDNGNGHLIGTELEAAKANRAHVNLVDAGLADLVDVRVGDALETLRSIDGEIDLLLLDGAVSLYLPVLKLVEGHLRSGAFVVGENAIEQSPGYLEYVRQQPNGYLSLALPFQEGRGNELTVRTR